jgi:hypothetical protein
MGWVGWMGSVSEWGCRDEWVDWGGWYMASKLRLGTSPVLIVSH